MTTVSIGLKRVNGVNTFHNSYGAQKNDRNKKKVISQGGWIISIMTTYRTVEKSFKI